MTYDTLGDHNRVIEDFNRAIVPEPGICRPIMPGNRLSQLGKYHQAIEDYNQVLKLNPEDAVAYTAGVLLWLIGQRQPGHRGL